MSDANLDTRTGAFLAGDPIDIVAATYESPDEWTTSARAYLRNSIVGASGAATVRVSVAAVSIVLARLDEQDGGPSHG